MSSVKWLVESGCLKKVPSKYAYEKNPEDRISEDEETIPTIDYSLLTHGTPIQRFKVIQDLGNACQEWGFFMVINHGVPKKLRDEIINSTETFFNLTEEEKQEYRGNELLDPIKCGTSFNVRVDKPLMWRDYLKILVHPHFVSPHKPVGFSEVLQEYCKRSREVASELLKGISKSLELEENYITKRMEVEVGSQMFVANLYPPCPQPEIAMGLPPHSDYGLLTLLIQNHLGGLQVMHKGKWVPINPLPDSIIINIGDHMEILTNGKYKSVVHRAVVNGHGTRISIGTAHGPPLETIVSPAPELANLPPPAYRGIKFREYVELQQSSQLIGKSCLDRIRI
ncbi:hypothetical protein P3X46_028744 [Hevea brasiliensis]|uniref:Fe2OG dioxygenase domain-containing protein n=1 Tax=Hevea brasiliensis TaxID=3981 RepID=A0ABQ9KQ38_HEVBR|nr:2-oxoglutarate-dependent dioxygenase 19 [Hevea brasiliensis]KAJ9146485.1 hypothetical protein P3X46_028744 [Hevea brasiliensis]